MSTCVGSGLVPLIGCCGGTPPEGLFVKTFYAHHQWYGFVRCMEVASVDYCTRYLVQTTTKKWWQNGILTTQVYVTTINRYTGEQTVVLIPDPGNDAGTALEDYGATFDINFALVESMATAWEFSWEAVGAIDNAHGTTRYEYSTVHPIEDWWADLLALYNALPAFSTVEYGVGVNPADPVSVRRAAYANAAGDITIHDTSGVNDANLPAWTCLSPDGPTTRVLGGYIPAPAAGLGPKIVRSRARWGQEHCRYSTLITPVECQALLGFHRDSDGNQDLFFDNGFAPVFTEPEHVIPPCSAVDCVEAGVGAGFEISFSPEAVGGTPSFLAKAVTMSPTLPGTSFLPCDDCNPAP